MCDGLHDAAVGVERVFDDLLAIASGGHRLNLDAGELPIDVLQKGAHQGYRVAAVGHVAIERDVVLGVQHHGLDRGGTRVDADGGQVVLLQRTRYGHLIAAVAFAEGLVLLFAFKQRSAADVGAPRAVVLYLLGDALHVKGLAVGLHRRAHGHKVKRIFGQQTPRAQRLVKGGPQLGKKGQRAAQVHHMPCDFAALRKAGNGLVDHRGEYGSANVLLARALVEQRLNIGLCKHAAARRDGVDLGPMLGQLVHLIGLDVQQRSHLVNKRAGAARAGAVHAHLDVARGEQDLCILSAQLDDHIGVGQLAADGHARCINLLRKGDGHAFCKPHARRT